MHFNTIPANLRWHVTSCAHAPIEKNKRSCITFSIMDVIIYWKIPICWKESDIVSFACICLVVCEIILGCRLSNRSSLKRFVTTSCNTVSGKNFLLEAKTFLDALSTFWVIKNHGTRVTVTKRFPWARCLVCILCITYT